MNDNRILDMARLADLVSAKSKHSDYQLLHPSLAALMPQKSYQPAGKYESQRQAYMNRHLPLAGLRILDLGANTGFFSLAAIEAGAREVVSQEGNREHAEFISLGAHCLGLEDRLEVRSSYFDFSAASCHQESFDLVLCLNVLHHLGDDFGDPEMSLDAAKTDMISSLNRLAAHARHCWMQLGFNWKGNRHRPLFASGTKRELIDFVKQGIRGHWEIERIAVADPVSRSYTDVTTHNLQRFDGLGEFLNRPLFLLRAAL